MAMRVRRRVRHRVRRMQTIDHHSPVIEMQRGWRTADGRRVRTAKRSWRHLRMHRGPSIRRISVGWWIVWMVL